MMDKVFSGTPTPHPITTWVGSGSMPGRPGYAGTDQAVLQEADGVIIA
jgi:hypothetical protein